MAIPTAITDLSTTASSNPPAGSESTIEGDNHIRAAYSFIRQNYDNKANIASPTFTGTPAAPTAAADTNTTQIATTAYVVGQGYAKLASPTFTGTVTAAALTTTGNTILGDASTDTLNVGNGGIVKDASGNVGIGTASPTGKLDVVGSTGTVRVETDGIDLSFSRAEINYITAKTASGYLAFRTNGTNERARIDASGYTHIAGTGGGQSLNVYGNSQTSAVPLGIRDLRSADGVSSACTYIVRNGSIVGSISTTNTATTFDTSSDYRLKNIAGNLTTSGAFIDALQPRHGTWKADGSQFVGFVAHELQAVSPSSVTGEKDGEQMQAVAYGSAELIANMVAELKALRARVAALEG